MLLIFLNESKERCSFKNIISFLGIDYYHYLRVCHAICTIIIVHGFIGRDQIYYIVMFVCMFEISNKQDCRHFYKVTYKGLAKQDEYFKCYNVLAHWKKMHHISWCFVK